MTRFAAPFIGSGQINKLGKTGSVVATGGEIRDFWHNGIYWRAHLFLTSGILTVVNGGEIEYLIVGGGGGGGMDMGGGGGGGGVFTGKTVINQGGHAVTVGAGGIGGPRAGTGTGSQGTSAHQFTISATAGGNSTFLGITALGGGFGGSSYFQYTPNNGFGGNGASGGGASGYSDGNTGRGGTGSQGFNGGGSSGQYYSGGGGGAGQAGGSGTGSGAAKGGDGVMSDILGIQLWWGAGGGGSGYSTNGGNGGRGGGGGGAVGITLGGQDAFNAGMPGGVGSTNSQTNTPGGHAGQNTGSGGGGGSHYSANNSGGNGGSGIVVVRYPLSPGFESPGNVVYEPLSLVAQGSGGITITGNNTTAVSFFKTSGSSVWDTQVYSLQPFTAPVTLEFNKLASPDFSDNASSYAMISLNADPTTNASHTSLDWAAYPYDLDNYQVYHNNSLLQNGGTWSSSQKFYIVYDTDGWIRHYNGSTLLYSVNKGTGGTVYLDSSLYSVNGGYSGFSNVRITKNSWNGFRYIRSTKVTLLNETSMTWDPLPGANSYTVVATPSLGSITVSGTTATFASAMSANTEYGFVITPNSGKVVTCRGYMLGYTGSAQVLDVGIGSAKRFTLLGAAGGGPTQSTTGPRGGRVMGTYTGTGTIYVYVGGKGGNYCRNTYTTLTCNDEVNEGQAGWNGGAIGGNHGNAYPGVNAGGGGATDIRVNGTALSDRILIAGGGGGYYSISNPTGNGGGSTANAGANAYGFGGGGGTQSAGGAGGARSGYSGANGIAGSLGSGGRGGHCPESWCLGGGGGGGGYYGGGGGESGDSAFNNGGSGGGGGSGFIGNSSLETGNNELGNGSSGNGAVLVIWDVE